VNPPVALTIAGSDSGGAAGIQADLKTFAAHAVFGASAITAITAQNSTEVREVCRVPTPLVVAQIDAVLDDLPVAATKTGMLASAETIVAVTALARAGRLPQLVVDPVLIASTGSRLLDPSAECGYLQQLVPAATVVTPNLHEAGALLGCELETLDDQRAAARALTEAGARWAVVKGGHATSDAGEDAVDVVCDGSAVVELRAPRVATANTHGSGCSFASAITAGLARGVPPMKAIRAAKTYVHSAIVGSTRWHLGAGHGPLDHFRWDDRNDQEDP
jgi:hydroxymethylpyrimidine/phosphomethylpyrimidine kinase